jgi:hypothetical protein
MSSLMTHQLLKSACELSKAVMDQASEPTMDRPPDGTDLAAQTPHFVP